MKKTTTLFNLFLAAAMFTVAQGQAQKTPLAFGKALNPESANPENGFVRCITSEYEKHLQDTDPSRMTDAQFEAWIAPYVERYKTDAAYRSENAGVITIPVVVHVIHSGQAVGVAPNITDSQVLSQITAMNNDYRKVFGTRGANTSAVGADTMIQFALAKQDPQGNPTNGVNHVNLCQDSWSTTEINNVVKPNTIWDPMSYLNMWSVNFSDATLLGYAQFPAGSGLPGVPGGGTANSDGVVSNYATFGSTDFNDGTFLMTAPYDKGRTMTHEVGHWLGLRHIWGDSQCGTDYCADTPTAHTSNYNCNPNLPDCDGTGVEMVQNYMDYTNDTCMNIFTIDQKARMVAVMNNAVRRKTLKTSTKNEPLALFANDAKLKLEESCTPVPSCEVAEVAAKAILTNAGTSPITSAVITYTFDNGTPQVFNWVGNLTAEQSATVFLPLTTDDSGVVNASITTVNGAADERATNNSTEGIYILPTAPTVYAVNKVNFNLQRDKFASETTWNIKNSTGTVLYNGGPYTNSNVLPALITETWTLPADGCYTFTINDTYGDGILSPGFYNITTPEGVTITSGSDFGGKATKVFATDALLGTNSFDSANSIQLYPNPTRNSMTISVSNATETPDTYSIYNTIGQQIAAQKISSNSDLTINTSSLSTGVYFIKLVKGSATKTLRFIKE